MYYGFKNYKEQSGKDYYDNNNNNEISIDNLKILKTEIKSSDFIENKNCGNDFEQSISLKSCIFLPVNSINDKEIYTKEYRHFYALKIIITKIKEAYKTKYLLNEGKYKIIPFSNNYFKIIIEGYQDYYISYNDEGIFIKNNDKFLRLKDYKNYSTYQKQSQNSKTDIYQGTFNLYTIDRIKSNYEVSLFSTSCEIDGLFDVLEDIKISDFGVNELYSNYDDNKIIKKDSLIVYEIKSGNKERKLLEQMLYKSHFINQYIKFIYNKPIYYIGFYRTKGITESEFKEYKVEENKIVNDINKVKLNDIKEQKINSIDNKIKTYNDKFKDDIKNINNSNISKTNENNETNETNENNDKKDKKENRIEIEEANIYEEETNFKSDLEKNSNDNQIIEIDSPNYYLYDKLNNLPLKITIFQLKDTIFGEYLKYEKEDLNLLRNLNKRMNNVETELGSIKMRLSNVENEVKKIEGIEAKVKTIEEKVAKIDDIEFNLKTLMSHFNLEYKKGPQ